LFKGLLFKGLLIQKCIMYLIQSAIMYSHRKFSVVSRFRCACACVHVHTVFGCTCEGQMSSLILWNIMTIHTS